MTQPSMFDGLTPEPCKSAKAPSAKPSWAANVTRATCHDCVTQLANGEFITAQPARWRRTCDGLVELYCYSHAGPRRDADHQATLRTEALRHAKSAAA